MMVLYTFARAFLSENSVMHRRGRSVVLHLIVYMYVCRSGRPFMTAYMYNICKGKFQLTHAILMLPVKSITSGVSGLLSALRAGMTASGIHQARNARLLLLNTVGAQNLSLCRVDDHRRYAITVLWRVTRAARQMSMSGCVSSRRDDILFCSYLPRAWQRTWRRRVSVKKARC